MLAASSFDGTSYKVTQLSKDIKNGLLPQNYHVVLDEAYPCTPQEMSPYKGGSRGLSREKDICNYFISKHRQVIERAFGILIQRWGVFWRPLRVSMQHRDLVVRVACKLHNICIEDFGYKDIQTVKTNDIPNFPRENDHREGDNPYPEWLRFPIYDNIKLYGQGYRSDLEVCDHREQWTEIIRKDHRLIRPSTSRTFKIQQLRK
jgi:hypothetical protein